MQTRRRLDTELVRRGLVLTRQRARREIDAGRVTVGGAPAPKAARLVAPHEPIEVAGPEPRYVSRAGEKLAGALAEFSIPVTGKGAVDVGASTGGFTDCLLQHGARSVVAVDVGHGQLHERIRRDPRVTVLERTNARKLTPELVGGAADIVVADLAFISLRTVAAALLSVAGERGELVLLVKPQFEAGRREASRGRGVIRDPQVWRQALDDVVSAFTARRAAIMGAMVSPLRGARGNVEFLVHLAARGTRRPVDLDAIVAGAVR